jgi:2-oxoglutarate dehydrogenase E1 component
VLLVSGKLAWELMAERESRGVDDVAVVRLEQLYPLPEWEVLEALDAVPAGAVVRWVQEEPANMGAWPHLRSRFFELPAGRRPWSAVCRDESSSPATGSAASHKLEQRLLLRRAFDGN